MKKTTFLLSIATIFIFFIMLSVAVRAGLENIKYPVPELANCLNEGACRAYCDARDNIERARVCMAFAKKYALLSQEEISNAEKYLALGVLSGPGGCANQSACDAYCEDTAHINECLDFAERYDLRDREEVAEGRKVSAVLAQGGNLPGGCRAKAQCMAYCDDPTHMRECVDFAEKAGFISEKELAEARKIIPLLEKGEKTPGNCGRKEACEAYCKDASHLDECISFAEKAGLMSPEELADAKRFIPYIKNGETPGRCARKEECETYCSDVAHFEECVAFAEKVGIISKEDAELAHKTKGQGPGGCKSKESCETFCALPENQAMCMNFAKEHGLAGEMAEVETKIRGEIENKMHLCAEKSCEDMIACLQEFQKDSRGGQESLPDAIKGKLDICVEEIKAKAIKGAGEGALRERAPQTPSAEQPQETQKQYDAEYKKRYEEEYKKQYDQEYKRQVQEQTQKQLQQTQQEPQSSAVPGNTPGAAPAGIDCSLFSAAPSCSYVGSPDSQNYKYCKQCFPDR